MATDIELERMEIDLRRLLVEASKYEELNTPEKLAGWVERILTQEGYVLRNGVWQEGNN